jgi:hypothetical protein
MAKSRRRIRGRGVLALPAEGDQRSLVDRILETPHLARAVPHFQPEVLHRVIETCGLEQCGELLALATPQQLAAVLDLDVWRAPQAGGDACFDAGRFGLWLQTLVDAGASVAAAKIAGMDIELMTAAFAQHARVFDLASVTPYMTTDGELVPAMPVPTNDVTSELGGYLIAARRDDAWEAIVAVLTVLEEEHAGYFHQLMGGCRSVSNSRPEIDGLDELMTGGEQILFDVALGREHRREQQRFVSPADARAFLRMSRHLPRDAARVAGRDPIVRAYFTASGVAAARASESDDIYSKRNEELGFLANALAAGCSVQGRAFTPPEAMAAAIAVCNLGLENWPHQWLDRSAEAPISSALVARRLPIDRDLIAAFQVGWTVLHDEVVMHAADRLMHALKQVRTFDREIQREVDALGIDLLKQTRAGTPWEARRAMDVIGSLDMLAATALLGLIDECPVLHGAVGAALPGSGMLTVSSSAFEFISGNQQIASIRAFLERLPDLLFAPLA